MLVLVFVLKKQDGGYSQGLKLDWVMVHGGFHLNEHYNNSYYIFIPFILQHTSFAINKRRYANFHSDLNEI